MDSDFGIRYVLWVYLEVNVNAIFRIAIRLTMR